MGEPGFSRARSPETAWDSRPHPVPGQLLGSPTGLPIYRLSFPVWLLSDFGCSSLPGASCPRGQATYPPSQPAPIFTAKKRLKILGDISVMCSTANPRTQGCGVCTRVQRCITRASTHTHVSGAHTRTQARAHTVISFSFQTRRTERCRHALHGLQGLQGILGNLQLLARFTAVCLPLTGGRTPTGAPGLGARGFVWLFLLPNPLGLLETKGTPRSVLHQGTLEWTPGTRGSHTGSHRAEASR